MATCLLAYILAGWHLDGDLPPFSQIKFKPILLVNYGIFIVMDKTTLNITCLTQDLATMLLNKRWVAIMFRIDQMDDTQRSTTGIHRLFLEL